MRKLTLAIAVAAGFVATPLLACPMHQAAAQTTGSTATASPMMCGTPAAAQAQQPGQMTQPARPGQSMGGMCPCCRNMALMQPQPGQPGSMQDMPGMGNMPGMQQDAPASPPAPSPAPETPRPN
jgi:hypothetical protein